MIRQNFLTGEYVIFSTERAKKPQSLKKQILTTSENCPFCLKNQDLQKNIIYENFNKEIIIIENKYPIIKKTKDFFGIHQVIIDTKSHQKKLQDFSDEHMFYLMKTIKDNFNIFYNEKKLRYVQFFKNEGFTAGASQPHSHWQILGIPILPKKQQKIVQAFKNFKNETGKCYFCDLNFYDFLIEENDDFIAICPEDSLYFYEINIIPKNHILSIRYLDDLKLKNLGKILRNSIKRLNLIFENLDYNICLFNALREADEHHFFFQIIPRLNNVGGYEFSTGMFVNSIFPELAAKNLKKVII